jgi:hypothetical protein
MGFAKEQMIQEGEQGWSFTGGWVCRGCVNDYALESAIDADADGSESCSFCSSRPAAPLDTLLGAFVKGLQTEYGDADDEGVGWDGREGGYQWWGPKWDTWDLIGEFDDVLVGPGLLDVVRDAVEDRTWVEVNFAHPRTDEALSASWKGFCHAIKYETRYVFWLRHDEDEEQLRSWGEVPTARILEELGALVERLSLVRTLPAGHRLARGRPQSGVSHGWGARELGTAPVDRATKSSRMSPAGIPLFYGSKDAATAAAEVRAGTRATSVSYGWFATSRPCIVVDFSNVERPPSIFDLDRSSSRRPLMFLQSFVDDLRARPRPTFEEIDYVPTQVVTEYLLKIFAPGRRVSGLIYPSSMTEGECVALAVDNQRCVEMQPGWAEGENLILGFEGSVFTA